ncbi:unnamed protein product [Amoebophrya sp. A120]|nr:unnamed protein product [Amoebophrya sp. A120]|eukprot:GSA120T00001654001.1
MSPRPRRAALRKRKLIQRALCRCWAPGVGPVSLPTSVRSARALRALWAGRLRAIERRRGPRGSFRGRGVNNYPARNLSHPTKRKPGTEPDRATVSPCRSAAQLAGWRNSRHLSQQARSVAARYLDSPRARVPLTLWPPLFPSSGAFLTLPPARPIGRGRGPGRPPIQRGRPWCRATSTRSTRPRRAPGWRPSFSTYSKNSRSRTTNAPASPCGKGRAAAARSSYAAKLCGARAACAPGCGAAATLWGARLACVWPANSDARAPAGLAEITPAAPPGPLSASAGCCVPGSGRRPGETGQRACSFAMKGGERVPAVFRAFFPDAIRTPRVGRPPACLAR